MIFMQLLYYTPINPFCLSKIKEHGSYYKKPVVLCAFRARLHQKFIKMAVDVKHLVSISLSQPSSQTQATV